MSRSPTSALRTSMTRYRSGANRMPSSWASSCKHDDGLDLTAQHLYIHYQTVYGGGDGVPCNVYWSDNYVRLCWQVPAQATQEPGTIQMMIYTTGTNSAGERVTWKTLPASYTIHDGLEIGGGIPEPDQSWYEQFVAQMEGKVSTAQGYANDAQASKTAAAGSATASAQSATASAQALADNKAYVESQKAAFVGYNKRETDLKYANALIGSAADTMHVMVDDAWEAPIPGLEIAGKSKQGADPSPDNPQEIVSTDVTAVTVTGANLLIPQISNNGTGCKASLTEDGMVLIKGISKDSEYNDLYLYGKWGNSEDYGLRGTYTISCTHNGLLKLISITNHTSTIKSASKNECTFTVTDENPINEFLYAYIPIQHMIAH